MKPAAAPVLSLKDIAKSFGSKTAVKDLSLDIHQGEIFGFLGPNGAGKTTTIRVILDVLRPDKGQIKIFGQDHRFTKTTHRRLGYLSGDMVLDGDLTAEQYLHFVGWQFGGQHDAKVKELAELLNIDLDDKIDSYSRGNKQKIALIAALMHQPELLVLDEPTNGFDPLIQEIFMDLIKKYQAGGGTVFMSSHILSEVQRLCSRVAFIKDGSLIGIKSIEELRSNSTKTIKVMGVTGEISKIKVRYKALEGLRLQESGKSSLIFTYVGGMQPLLKFFAGYNLGDINIEEPELEEIFLEYYTRGKS